MTDIDSESKIILSQNQLKVLLRGSGFVHIKGLRLDKTVLDNNIVINCLMELVNRNLIYSDGIAFKMNEQIKKSVQSIGNAKSYITVCSRNVVLPDLCCYINEELITVCNFSGINNEYIKISEQSFESFFSRITDEEYLPTDEEKFSIDNGVLEKFEAERLVSSKFKSNDNSRVICEINKMTSEKTIIKSVKIIEYSLYNYAIYNDGNKVERRPINRDYVYEIIKMLVEG